MFKKYASIRVRPIVYDTDTNGDYLLDQNGNKIVLVQPNQVDPSQPYDILTEIEEENY
jgi:hypothetical protein